MPAASTKVWMPLYPADYLADTQHLTTELHGAYFLLLLAYWTRQGPLRDSDAELAMICRMPMKRWLSARPTLAAFFEIHDGVWVQGRCEREIAAAQRTKEAAKNGAALTNAKRWGNRKRVAVVSPSDRLATRSAVADGVAVVSPNGRSSPSPSPSEEIPPSPPHSEEPSPDASTGFGGAGEGGISELEQVETVWAIWPKKVDSVQGKHAVLGAIRTHGFDVVLNGTRKIVAADAQRKASPPGRYLPRPTEFFEAGRYLDDPAQYGPREQVGDVQGLRMRVAELETQIRDHPGNPANTEGSLERKREALPEFRALCEELNQARKHLNQTLAPT